MWLAHSIANQCRVGVPKNIANHFQPSAKIFSKEMSRNINFKPAIGRSCSIKRSNAGCGTEILLMDAVVTDDSEPLVQSCVPSTSVLTKV